MRRGHAAGRVKELQSYADSLEKAVAEAVDDPTRRTSEGLALAGEIRTHLKGLAKGERVTFVKRAIDEGDRRTVAAVLHAPPYLSGLTDRQLGTLRDFAANAFAPTEHAQARATRAAIDRVTSGGSRLVTRYGQALKLKDTPAARANAGLNDLKQTA